MTRPATDCPQTDRAFGFRGHDPIGAAPVGQSGSCPRNPGSARRGIDPFPRPDLRREQTGSLIPRLTALADYLKAEEAACSFQAFETRLNILAQHIATVEEIKARVVAALERKRNGKDHR